MWRAVLMIMLAASGGCQPATPQPTSKESRMPASTFPWPAGAVRCARGDHLAHRDAERWKAYRVDDFVQLDRLVPFGADALIEERHLLDSTRPAYAGEVHVLLTAFARDFASSDETLRAAAEGDLGAPAEGLCRKLASFRDDDTRVLAGPRP